MDVQDRNGLDVTPFMVTKLNPSFYAYVFCTFQQLSSLFRTDEKVIEVRQLFG